MCGRRLNFKFRKNDLLGEFDNENGIAAVLAPALSCKLFAVKHGLLIIEAHVMRVLPPLLRWYA